jgi:predicted nucleic acid-binding protein
MEEFFRRLKLGQVQWIASDVVEQEAINNLNLVQRFKTLKLLALSTEWVSLQKPMQLRAETLEHLGYDAFDALHLACAELASVDLLFTTDDRFIRRAKRGLGNPTVPVVNPVSYL